MREYLFRGKRCSDNQWVYGCLLHGISPSDAVTIVSRKDNLFAEDEVDPASVGMYVGLKDSTGQMIFEGDTVYARMGAIICKSGDDGWVASSTLYVSSIRQSFVMRALQDANYLHVAPPPVGM